MKKINLEAVKKELFLAVFFTLFKTQIKMLQKKQTFEVR